MKKNNSKQSLGKLESEIMEIVWKTNSASVRHVLNKMKKRKKIAYTTVMTVMSRLADKQLLNRKLNESGAYIYSPTQSKQAFLESSSKQAINHLIKEFGEVAVAQFIDIIESGNLKNFQEWKKKLKNIK